MHTHIHTHAHTHTYTHTRTHIHTRTKHTHTHANTHTMCLYVLNSSNDFDILLCILFYILLCSFTQVWRKDVDGQYRHLIEMVNILKPPSS